MSFLGNLFGKKKQDPQSVENLLGLEAAQRQADSVTKQIPEPATAIASAAAVANVPAAQPVQARKITSLVGEGARMRGDLISKDSVHVSGSLQGSVHITEEGGTISVSTTGVIDGSVSAESVLIGGRVIGSVHAKTLRMFPGSLVEGDVFCERLLIDDGARLDGRSRRYDEANMQGVVLVESSCAQEAEVQDTAKKNTSRTENVNLDDVMDTIIAAQSGADVVEIRRQKAA